MYKRKMKLSPIHISLIALAILVVIAVIVTFAVKKDEPKEPAAQSGIVYDDSAIEGGWETLSQEEIEQRLNDKVQAGMINISCNTAPYFKDGKSEGNVMLVNELNNLYPQKVEFYRNDTGEKIYESKAIAVGSKIERAKLDVELPAGEYECTAYFSNCVCAVSGRQAEKSTTPAGCTSMWTPPIITARVSRTCSVSCIPRKICCSKP